MMQYRMFGKTGLQVSAVGFGANRFTPLDLQRGIEYCAELVVEAANFGVNFFDSASTYSNGKCEQILNAALRQIKGTRYVCGKSHSSAEKTGDEVLRRIELSLEKLGIDAFDFYYMWSIKSLAQYAEIMRPGGPYEGALRAKDRGLIRHICFSNHAPREDTKRIIEDGAFEGALFSYSLLNHMQNDALLKSAAEQGMGVAIMNPLGGGIIPGNSALFEYATMPGDADITASALKFVYAHKEVSTILCGISDSAQLRTDVNALSALDDRALQRIERVSAHLAEYSGLCTGCAYCRDCPAGIPIPEMMTAYNSINLRISSTVYNREDPALNRDIELFRQLDGQVVFETANNPCIRCGLCETACTQSLPITATIADIYKKSGNRGVPLDAKRERLGALLNRGFRRVGFYTARIVTAGILELYRRLFGDFPFEVFVFDRDPDTWGKDYHGFEIKPPSEIPVADLDLCLITNYIHCDEIYQELADTYKNVHFQKLYDDEDVPWIY